MPTLLKGENNRQFYSVFIFVRNSYVVNSSVMDSLVKSLFAVNSFVMINRDELLEVCRERSNS